MNKITLDEVESGYKVSTINANFQEIQRILNDQVLFRQTTEPNSMAQAFDANNYPIINVRTPKLNKEAANKLYVDEAIARASIGGGGGGIGDGQYELLVARIEDAEAAITSEASVRASEDSAMATVLDQLNVSVGQVSADIVSESTARATADSSMASSITTLQSRVGTNEAAIASEVATRTTQYSSLASSISTINANVASNTSAITSEATARTSADSALASQISTVSANVASNTAAITSESAARATADSVISVRVDNVTADLGGLSTSVSTQMSAVNSRLGVAEAKYTLKLDVNGYVSGFESIAGASSSSFTVKADVFKITMPGYGDYVPFSVGPSSLAFNGFTSWDNVQGATKPANNATVGATIGTNLFGTFTSTNIGVFMPNAAIGSAQILNAAIKSAHIEDAAITSAKIGNAEIGTLKLAGETVVVPRSAYTTSEEAHPKVGATASAGWQTIQSCYIDAGGANVAVLGNFAVKNYTIGTARLVAPSGAVLAEGILPYPYGVSASTTPDGQYTSMSLQATSTEIGTYNIQITATANSVSYLSVTYYATVYTRNRSLILIGTKR